MSERVRGHGHPRRVPYHGVRAAPLRAGRLGTGHNDLAAERQRGRRAGVHHGDGHLGRLQGPPEAGLALFGGQQCHKRRLQRGRLLPRQPVLSEPEQLRPGVMGRGQVQTDVYVQDHGGYKRRRGRAGEDRVRHRQPAKPQPHSGELQGRPDHRGQRRGAGAADGRECACGADHRELADRELDRAGGPGPGKRRATDAELRGALEGSGRGLRRWHSPGRGDGRQPHCLGSGRRHGIHLPRSIQIRCRHQ